MGPDGVGIHGDGEVVRPDPPPVEVRYPRVVRNTYRSIITATVGGASLGFGLFSVAFSPDSIFGWLAVGIGGATAVGNLILGTRLTARSAFFAGRVDMGYRLALASYRLRVSGQEASTEVWNFEEEPTYPEDE